MPRRVREVIAAVEEDDACLRDHDVLLLRCSASRAYSPSSQDAYYSVHGVARFDVHQQSAIEHVVAFARPSPFPL
jgi:hypothetical protein